MASRPLAIRIIAAASTVRSKRFWFAGLLVLLAGAAHGAQFTINGPAGSGQFGTTVTTLPNGNIVVTDPLFDAPGPIPDVGAVYLYRPNGTLISTLVGSSAGDRLSDGGVTVLRNGNYVVRSPGWDNGAIADAGAVSFGSGVSGISGVVSPANSLVGSTAGDQVGSTAGDQVGRFGVTVLSNGDYVVLTPDWDNDMIVNAGAVTFGSGVNGISGVVSPANSLVGSTANDLASTVVIALSNGNYVVSSYGWDNGATVDAGAVTFGSGVNGISGLISPANSLVGSRAGDLVGLDGVTALSNGNYVVASSLWDNGAIANAGAVTFGSGTSGISGLVTPVNSLVGSTARDEVGRGDVTGLSNGNYVVRSPSWDNGLSVDVGATTFGSGTSGISGPISLANSLVGSTARDSLDGVGRVTALSNGNYVVGSPDWDNGATVNAGAATFGSGTTGVSGVVSAANSLVGSAAGDGVGAVVTALSNGNYVARSQSWDNGAIANAGAATFGSGTSGISGVVSPANSLVGSTALDFVGVGVTRLSNGNYVVGSPHWDNGATGDAGAATFGSGTSGISGVVTPANSLVGSRVGDRVGSRVTRLNNGNYVVLSPSWANGDALGAGAVTFGSGLSGISGVISTANSLVGSRAGDLVGLDGVTALINGNYVVASSAWDNGAIADAGAVTFGSGTSGISGLVTPANSLVGSTARDEVGRGGVTGYSNGNYVVGSVYWDNGATLDAGAITLGLSAASVVGPITNTHSVLGAVEFAGNLLASSYDPVRNQLAVSQRASNRVILHRTGIATAINIVGDTPDPSNVGQPVTFTATVVAAPNAPANGQVTFTASSGESCVDTTPTATSATTASYSCTISFTAPGNSTVVAEYTGSILHAYSGSEPEIHTTILDLVFGNGFENP